MNPKYFGLNEAIGKIIRVPTAQGRIVAIAVALAASAQGRLPSSEVDNLPGFYGDQVHAMMVEKISDVGESVVFASNAALDYAQLFWKMRYMAAFPNKVLVENAWQMDRLMTGQAARSCDITSLWAGGVSQLSEELSQFMNQYSTEIMMVAARVAVLLQPEAEADDAIAPTQVIGG